MVGLLVISSKRAYSIPRSAEPKNPCGRPLLTLTSIGITQTLKGRSGWVFVGSPGAHNIFFEPSEHLWQVWGLILNTICLSYCLVWDSPLSSEVGYLFLMGSNFLLLMVVQQQVAILEFSQEKMSACPSTLPSCFAFFFISLLTKKTLKTKRELLIYINSNVNHITIFAFQSSLLGEILFFLYEMDYKKLLHLNIFKNSVWDNVRTK